MIKCSAFVLLLAACSRETPAPPTQDAGTTNASPTAAASAPQPAGPTYDDAVTWFRTTPGFHFVLQENDLKAAGEMQRSNVGAERVRMTLGGQEWSAEAGSQGVVWKRGGKEAPAPDGGNRLYQRVTVAFDPDKREGQAQLVEPGHFRFTDANSGAIHDVWIDDRGRITKMTIGSAVSMTLTNQQ